MATKTKTKTKAKARSTTASPFAQQAQAEAFLRTNPERSTLAQQLADARGDRDTSVSAANTAANANVSAARGAPAAYQRTYDDALSHVAAAIAVPGADNPATGAGRDAAQTRGRLAEMLASAQTDAKQRELSAREGGQYAVGQANAGYAKTSDTLSSRLRSLAQEQGVYTAQREGELSGDATRLAHDSAQKSADRANAREIASAHDRTSLTTTRIRTTAAAKARAKADARKRATRWATPQQAGRLQDSVASIRSWIAQNKADYGREAGGDARKQRALLAQDLSVGVPGQSFVDPKTGAINRDPGVPKAGSDLALRVALDLAFDGHLSAANVRRLHERRYKVSDLGFPVAPAASAPSGAALYSKGDGRPD